jgi:hypothetical protein
MQGRRVLGLPEPHVGPSAGNTPDAQKVALLRQLAGFHGFLADEAVALVPRPIGRPCHLNLNEKFHRPPFDRSRAMPPASDCTAAQSAAGGRRLSVDLIVSYYESDPPDGRGALRHTPCATGPAPQARRRSAQPPSAQEMTFSGSIVTIVRSAGQSET